MKIEKTHWGVNGNKVSLAVPLTKIDKEKRLVHGFASLDNIDTQGDLVTADASSRAFGRFRGNIREMHQNIAVGKMVSFVEDTFYDKNSDKHYKGVFVSAYVSKGAPDTWEKVLDGTLSGFSIGGEILDSEEEFNKDAGQSVRKVTDYSLTELSLVDNPANQLANIASFEKVAGETVLKGSIATMESATAFYCYEDAIAKVSTNDEEVCPNCGNEMNDIGWFEYSDLNEKNQKLSETVKKYLDTNNMQATATNEGGVDVAEDTVEKNARPDEAGPITESGEAGQLATELASSVDNPASDLENAPAEPVEVSEVEEVDGKAAEDNVSEVDSAEDELTKMFNSFREQVEEVLKGNVSELHESVHELSTKFEEFTKSADEKIDALKSEHDELNKKFGTVAEEVEKVEKSLNSLKSEGAVRKSNDLGGSEEESETVEKSQSGSLWGGHFLGIDSLR